MANPGDFLCWLLELLGLSTEGAGERARAIALLVFLIIFGLIAAIFTVGLARQLWGGVAGLCTVLLVVVSIKGTR